LPTLGWRSNPDASRPRTGIAAQEEWWLVSDLADHPCRLTVTAMREGEWDPKGTGSGNVSEYVEDCRHENDVGAPADGTAWTTDGCKARMMRRRLLAGPNGIRIAARICMLTIPRGAAIGFLMNKLRASVQIPSYLNDFPAMSDGMALTKAFTRIRDPKVRRAIALVEQTVPEPDDAVHWFRDPPRLLRCPCGARRRNRVRRLSRTAQENALVRPRKAPVRWAEGGARLSVALHPSCRDLEPAPDRGRRQGGDLQGQGSTDPAATRP
jgi:hypothetical protein